MEDAAWEIVQLMLTGTGTGTGTGNASGTTGATKTDTVSDSSIELPILSYV